MSAQAGPRTVQWTLDGGLADENIDDGRIPCPRGCGKRVYPRGLHTHISECPVTKSERARDDPDQRRLSL